MTQTAEQIELTGLIYDYDLPGIIKFYETHNVLPEQEDLCVCVTELKGLVILKWFFDKFNILISRDMDAWAELNGYPEIGRWLRQAHTEKSFQLDSDIYNQNIIG